MTQVLTRLAIFSLAGFTSAAARAQPLQDHPHAWYGGGDWGHMMFGPLMMILFIVLVVVVVVVVVFAVRWLGGARHGVTAEPRSGNTNLH